MKSFFLWLASIFEDQAGSASSKRIAMFICLFFYWMLVAGSLQGKPINDNVLFTVTGIILFGLGAVTAEFFKKPNS